MESTPEVAFSSNPVSKTVSPNVQITLYWNECTQAGTSTNSTSTNSTSTNSTSTNSTFDKSVYKCKVDSGLLVGVPFFDAALSGKFLESSRKEVWIRNPNATRDNAIAWLKFRQWIHHGFEGTDPRISEGKVAVLSPYLITLAEYLGDVQITARFFPGAVVYATLVEHSIVPSDHHNERDHWNDFDNREDPFGNNDRNDRAGDRIRFKTNISSKPFGKPIILSAGFYSRDDIQDTLMLELNARYNEYYGRDIVYCTSNFAVDNPQPTGFANRVYVCQPEHSTSEWDHGRPLYNSLPLTRMILFECRPLNVESMTWRLLNDDISSFTDMDKKLSYNIGYDRLYSDWTDNSQQYVFHHYNKWNISDAAIKVSFDIAFAHHWMYEVSDIIAYADDDGSADRFLHAIQRIELKCVVKLAPAPRVSHCAPVPPNVGVFPAGLSEELTGAVCTEFIYNFAKKTSGIGMDKLRKFALSVDNELPIAELIWESDPIAVCSILRVPKKSHGSASKKSFAQLAAYATSILRVKYGFTDTYTFDDGELARLQKQIDELNEKLRPFEYILRRCGEATLERIGDQYDRCEIDNPADLRYRLDRAELAYVERYDELVKRAKVAAAKTDHSRYDYLCRK